tara:strand:- start:12262 stop:12816 length:555 start_codon:yes stop_codon:yes gene_type:complete
MAISDYMKQLLVAASYKETLDSVLDDDSWTKYDNRKAQFFTKEFKLGDEEYAINFNKFVIKDDDGDVFNNIFDVNLSKYENGEKLMTITNTGNAFEVFSIVGQMLEKFLTGNDVVDVTGFFFSAKEPSRRALYKRYASIIEKRFSDMYTRVIDCKKFNLFSDYKSDELYLFMRNDIYKKAKLYQ